MKTIDIKGATFGDWVVLDYVGKSKWSCRCKCGEVKNVISATLRNGTSKNCGCRKFKHGYEGTKVYRLWAHMKERCFKDTHKSFKDYGGRGITVCKEWLEAKVFIDWALNNGYEEGLSLERIDTNGNYEPANCKFIPLGEQANNRRSSRWITIGEETKTLASWAETFGIGPKTLRHRIEAGWPKEEWSKQVRGR